MIGAIIGDIIGSKYEFNKNKDKNCELFTEKSVFTDDTVCTVVITDWLRIVSILGEEDSTEEERGELLCQMFRAWCKHYPSAGYGPMFKSWLNDYTKGPYGSYGNGSAMRVSPVAYYSKTEEECLRLAKESAQVTHNHPEGILGAQITAIATFIARQSDGKNIDAIKSTIVEKTLQLTDSVPNSNGYLSKKYKGYMDSTVDEIRKTYGFFPDCTNTVAPAIRIIMEATSYEDAIRNAVSLGGDADTLGAIVGAIAEPLFRHNQDKKIPESFIVEAMNRVDDTLREQLESFNAKFHTW